MPKYLRTQTRRNLRSHAKYVMDLTNKTSLSDFMVLVPFSLFCKVSLATSVLSEASELAELLHICDAGLVASENANGSCGCAWSVRISLIEGSPLRARGRSTDSQSTFPSSSKKDAQAIGTHYSRLNLQLMTSLLAYTATCNYGIHHEVVWPASLTSHMFITLRWSQATMRTKPLSHTIYM